MIIRNYILSFILLFLFSCSSVDQKREIASIPSLPTCQNSIVLLIKKINPAYEKNYLLLEREAEVAFSAYDFSVLASRFRQKKFKDSRLASMLYLSPFAKEMEISKSELKELASQINTKNLNTKEEIKSEMMAFFPALRDGTKVFGKKRDYDTLLHTLKAKNQCGFGSCWAYAQTAQIESQLSLELGTDIPLSAEHFYAQYIKNELKGALFKSRAPGSELFSEGGWGHAYFAYLPHFGLMPEEAFKPKTQFISGNVKKNLMDDLRARTKQFFKDKKSLPRSEVNTLRQIAAQDLEDIVEKYTGRLEKEFMYKGKRYTPKSFYEEFFDHDSRKVTNYTRGPPRSQLHKIDVQISTNDKTRSQAQFYKSAATSLQDLEDIIKSNIDNNKAISYTMNTPVNSYYSFIKRGEVTVIDSVTGKAHIPGPFVKTRGGHVLVIVGYELDYNGKIKTVKIQNSWGKFGDEGFLHMDKSMFWKMMKKITVID